MLLHKQTNAASPMPKSKKPTNKLIAGFAAFAVTAIVATSGLAAAATPGSGHPTKEACMKAGFKNYGQCMKEWEAAKNHPGSGYGGNTSVAVNLNNLTINHSNNNVIEVIVNIFR
jgi:hypothetical protein